MHASDRGGFEDAPKADAQQCVEIRDLDLQVVECE
jgi:hypothetical protein